MFRPLYLLIFRLIGWTVEGSFPLNLKKFIVAVAPHTSNWDFVIGVMARSIVGIQRAKFLGKSSLFKPPFGALFKWLGGYPVDRTSSHDMVHQVVGIFNRHDEFILAIAPEGTRKKVAKLRTGFYYIAFYARVPIITVGFDYRRKIVVIAHPFYPTGEIDADMEVLMDFYKAIKGRNIAFGID
jgi:1-acyl-sn-glycerol-3-phosphate acyltransferase